LRSPHKQQSGNKQQWLCTGQARHQQAQISHWQSCRQKDSNKRTC